MMDKLKRILDAIVKNNVVFVIALIAAFNVFGPLGFLLLLYKAGVFKSFFEKSPGSVRSTGQNSQQMARMEKYRIMTEGRSAESIDYLASAVGVPYATALRDLQQMVSEGSFGPEAYINYVDKTLVLLATGRQPTGNRTNSARNTQFSGASQSSKTTERAKASRTEHSTQNARAAQTARTSRTQDDTSGDKSRRKGGAESKNPDQSLRRLLLVVGIILLVFGCITISALLSEGFYTVSNLTPALLMLGGGAFSLFYRGGLKKRANRFKLYQVAVAGQDYVPLEELASKAGISVRKLKKDLEAMLEKGLLPATAYIDHGNGTLVLRAGASPKAEEPPTAPPEDDENRYRAILKQIRALNDAIPDPDVSDRIDEIETLTAKIFQAVQEKPEKLPQIKSFMSYYLPTTLKLLRTYAEFENAGAEGANIQAAKTEIERILDTLVDGFRKQLDKLFEADAMDIASDIDVLENMLRRDGLTGDGSAFGSSAAAFKEE